MTVPTPLPEPSQSPNWAAQLNAAITDRYEDAKQAAADVADTINTGRLSETELAATFLPKADTGATGLALLAAALPADAREALDITIDTSVGTRVMVGGVMIYGDTGWRDISGHLGTNWNIGQTAGHVRIRRTHEGVHLSASVTPNEPLVGEPRSGTYTSFITGLDPSIAPPSGTVVLSKIGVLGQSSSDARLRCATTGRLDMYSALDGTWGPSNRLELASFWADTQTRTWPTSLPGSPA